MNGHGPQPWRTQQHTSSFLRRSDHGATRLLLVSTCSTKNRREVRSNGRFLLQEAASIQDLVRTIWKQKPVKPVLAGEKSNNIPRRKQKDRHGRWLKSVNAVYLGDYSEQRHRLGTINNQSSVAFSVEPRKKASTSKLSVQDLI